MNFLQLNKPREADYGVLGYGTNPFPKRGRVVHDVFVDRPELGQLRIELSRFLSHPENGGFWALQGAQGYGKSNFLLHLKHELDAASGAGQVTDVGYRLIGSNALTPRAVAKEMLEAIGVNRTEELITVVPTIPDRVRATDFGQFWAHVNERKLEPATSAAFLHRWLAGEQTYKDERALYGIVARERLAPALAFPYLHILSQMLAECHILKGLLLMLDELEDAERLSRAELAQYVHLLKTLLNLFNWNGLFVIIAGAPSVFNRLTELLPSLAARWVAAVLEPVKTADGAVRLANAYKQHAALPGRQADVDELTPNPVVIKSIFIELFQRDKLVSQRALLDALHDWVERRVSARDTP